MEEQKLLEEIKLSMREESIQKLISGLKNAISECDETSLKLDTSNYVEWSTKLISNQAKYLGRIDALIQIFELEYRCRGGKL